MIIYENFYIWTFIYKDIIGYLDKKTNPQISREYFIKKYLLRLILQNSDNIYKLPKIPNSIKELIELKNNSQNFIESLDMVKNYKYNHFKKNNFYLLPEISFEISFTYRRFLFEEITINYFWSKLIKKNEKKKFISHLFYLKYQYFKQPYYKLENYYWVLSKFFYKIKDKKLKIYFIKQIIQNLTVFKLDINDIINMNIFLNYNLDLIRNSNNLFGEIKNIKEIKELKKLLKKKCQKLFLKKDFIYKNEIAILRAKTIFF